MEFIANLKAALIAEIRAELMAELDIEKLRAEVMELRQTLAEMKQQAKAIPVTPVKPIEPVSPPAAPVKPIKPAEPVKSAVAKCLEFDDFHVLFEHTYQTADYHRLESNKQAFDIFCMWYETMRHRYNHPRHAFNSWCKNGDVLAITRFANGHVAMETDKMYWEGRQGIPLTTKL